MTLVNGIEIATPADVAALVESQLGGRGPWDARSDYSAVDGLKRALQEAGALAPSFAATLVALLRRPELPLRAGAIAALPAATAVSGDDAVAAFDAHPDRFRGVAMPDGYPAMGDDLEAALVMALAQAGATGGTALTDFYVRHLHGSSSIWALLGLAVASPDWLIAHAAQAVPKRMVVGVLGKLPDQRRREALIRALAPWGSDAASTIASPGWKRLALSPADKSALESLLQSS